MIAKNVGKFAGEKLLFSDSQFTLYRQERVALMGQNGSGKSTLIRCLLSDTPLDEGEIRLGANIKVGYLPQKLSFEKPELRILAYVKTKISDEQIARQTLARFGFLRKMLINESKIFRVENRCVCIFCIYCKIKSIF